MSLHLLHVLVGGVGLLLWLAAATPAHADTFVVTAPWDVPDAFAGDHICGVVPNPTPPRSLPPCTLRAALQEANSLAGPHVIQFAIGAPGSLQTIDLTSALPWIISSVTIDGRTQGGAGYAGPPLIELNGAGAGAGARGLYFLADNSAVYGLAINRFSGFGIETAASTTTIQGNYIGTDPGGTIARGNNVGIRVDGVNHRVGGTSPGTRNLISGNTTSGVQLWPFAGYAIIQGNSIGTDVTGAAALGNGVGIELWGYSNTIGGTAAGAGNVIAFNSGPGIDVGLAHSMTWNNAILGNSIHSNGALGIDLAATAGGRADGVTPNDAQDWDVGANFLQNYPILTSASPGAAGAVTGTLNSEPNKTYRIELFSSPACDPSGHGEGRTFLSGGNVTTDSSGNASFATPIATLAGGQVVTATATDLATNDTSEFSACRVVTAAVPPGITVSPTSGLVTTEAGGTATFTVVLRSAPTATVTIALSSSDTTEGTVAPTTLTFTPASWNAAQTVTVTGVDDSAVDGNVAYTVVTAPAQSADPGYNGVNAPDVAATNVDNDGGQPPAACSPRPPVKIAAVPAGGLLRVTIAAGAGHLQELRFPNDPHIPNWNAVVLITEGQIVGQTVQLPPGRAQTVIYVNRQAVGQAATVPFIVVDGCGDWPTFVGGGPGAF